MQRTTRPGAGALPPAGSEARAQTPPDDDNLMAQEWLLSTLPEPSHEQVRSWWQRHLVPMLPLGVRFSVVRIPARLLCRVAEQEEAPAGAIDDFLVRELGGGAVICDISNSQYNALVPAARAEDLWRDTSGWGELGIAVLGAGSWLGVPGPARTSLDLDTYSSYWSVPVVDPPALCEPHAVARLVGLLRDGPARKASPDAQA